MMSPSRKDESERKPFLMGIVHFFEYLQSIHCVHRIAVIITQWPTFTFDIWLFFSSFLFFYHLLFSHSSLDIPSGLTIRTSRIYKMMCLSHPIRIFREQFCKFKVVVWMTKEYVLIWHSFENNFSFFFLDCAICEF